MMSLVIDTATDRGVAAICIDGKMATYKEFDAGFASSHMLLPVIDELVKERKDLKYIACGIGPGSYTGIRVAVAMAKSISFALNIPLVGISSLKGFIPFAHYEGSFAAVIDARIGGLYCILGHMSKGVVHFDTEEKLFSSEQFEQLLPSISLIVTSQKEPILKRFPGLQVEIIERTPSPEQLCTHAHETFCKTGGVVDGKLELLYLRKTQAEIEKSK